MANGNAPQTDRARLRKLVMFNRVSLDGFYAGPNGSIDWFIRDSEVDRALRQGAKSDTLVLGRVTYQLFENVWPRMAADPNAPEEARSTGKELNQMTKVVFSRTLKEVTWENSKLVSGDISQEVRTLKQGPGSDILIFGSGSLVQQLAPEGLIDDYFMLITPLILGTGKSLFEGVKNINLKLLESRSFETGNVLLHYAI
jgi:dihydrofolate reductase